MSMFLVAGLGNPGRAYTGTRHNAGAAVVETLAARLNLAWRRSLRFSAQIARWDRPARSACLLAKPATYMNESGRSVRALADFHKLAPSAVIAVYDDLTIELGRVKITVRGSAGGHNGVASLLEHLGGGFIRYRIGIGPRHPPDMDLKDFVLGKFTSDEQIIFHQHLATYADGLALLIDRGADEAMNQLNRRDRPS